MSTRQRLTLVCQLCPYTAYTLHAIQIVRQLERLYGVHVSIRPIQTDESFGAALPADIRARIVHGLQPEEWELLLCPPHFTPTPGKKTVYFTMYESTEISDPMLFRLNRAEAVIVPCAWNQHHFKLRSVAPHIFVVPLGVSPCFTEEHPLPAGSTTVFAAAGRTAHGRDRKGLDAVIRSFQAAFPYEPEVRLQIKCYPDCQLPPSVANDKRISVERNHMAEEQVAAWLAKAHCFVSAACGEGWGLWQHQSMALGRPVICAAYGGLAEFIGPNNGYLVHYREAPASEDFGGKWALPDLGMMIAQMRRVHANRAECEETGRLAKGTVKGLTWGNSCSQLACALSDCGALQLPRQIFAKPAITHYDYSPPAMPSVMQQATAKGFKVERLPLPTTENVWWCNPSVALINGEEVWFARQVWRCERGLQSQIYSCHRNGDIETLSLPGVAGDGWEDPRAYADEQGAWVSYTKVFRHGFPTQEIAILSGTERIRPVSVWHPEYGGNGISSYNSDTPEKNWVWFQHEGIMHFIYWLEPMKVVQVINGKPGTVYESNRHYAGWQFGVRHGGGSPTRIGDEYFGFCHSLLPWYGKDRWRYFICAYAFEAKPPFALTRVSLEPLFYSEDVWGENPCSVVICGGAILRDGVWTLALGARDEQCLRVEVPHRTVEKGMVTL